MDFSDCVFIVFLSEDWDVPPRGFTRKRILSALANEGRKRGLKILCVDRPVTSVVTLLHQPFKLLSWLLGRRRLRSVDPGLYLTTLAMFLHERVAPLVPGAVDANKRVLRAQVESCLRSLGLADRRRLSWIFHPYQRDMIGVARQETLIYECHDDYAAAGYVTTPQAERIAALEDVVLEEADVVFTTARQLWRRCSTENAHTYYIPNGVDYELFSRPAPTPADMLSIPRPRIGYLGEINHKIDFGLISLLAESHPECNIVFVGSFDWHRSKGIPAGFEAVTSRPNVTFLGTRAYESVPGYLQACDVLIIPYLIGDPALRSAYPLKLNEYLAAGRPVVSTKFCLDMEDFAEVITLATNAQEFRDGIDEALSNPNIDKLRKAQEIAQKNSWISRARKMLDIIEDSHHPQSIGGQH